MSGALRSGFSSALRTPGNRVFEGGDEVLGVGTQLMVNQRLHTSMVEMREIDIDNQDRSVRIYEAGHCTHGRIIELLSEHE